MLSKVDLDGHLPTSTYYYFAKASILVQLSYVIILVGLELKTSNPRLIVLWVDRAFY